MHRAIKDLFNLKILVEEQPLISLSVFTVGHMSLLHYAYSKQSWDAAKYLISVGMKSCFYRQRKIGLECLHCRVIYCNDCCPVDENAINAEKCSKIGCKFFICCFCKVNTPITKYLKFAPIYTTTNKFKLFCALCMREENNSIICKLKIIAKQKRNIFVDCDIFCKHNTGS